MATQYCVGVTGYQPWERVEVDLSDITQDFGNTPPPDWAWAWIVVPQDAPGTYRAVGWEGQPRWEPITFTAEMGEQLVIQEILRLDQARWTTS